MSARPENTTEQTNPAGLACGTCASYKPPMTESLTWHQMQALKRSYRTRNLPAHILDPDTSKGMTALCGYRHPKVTIDPAYRDNPENKTCAKCKHKADGLSMEKQTPDSALDLPHTK